MVDDELDFSDDTLFEKEPHRIRNAYIVDGLIKQAIEATSPDNDNITAYAHALAKAKDTFGNDFGNSVGVAHGKYSRAVAKQLHHKHRYSPLTCSCYDAEGNKKPCKPGCKRL